MASLKRVVGLLSNHTFPRHSSAKNSLCLFIDVIIDNYISYD